MKIDYTVDENDYLIFNLFSASKSERIKKIRQRTRVLLSLGYVLLGIFLLYNNRITPAIIFFSFGVLWYFVYPIYERKRYIKQFKALILENFKERLGRNETVEFFNDYIIIKENGSETKTQTTEIEEINEIPTTILVKFKAGQSLILPKDKIEDIAVLTVKLKEMATFLNINYNVDEKWQWK